MGFAEQKVELLKIVADADEEMTGKLIEFAKQLNNDSQHFTQDELANFHERREEYLKNPESAVSWEDSMTRLRNKLNR
jgi:hypothetical protein